MRTATTHLRAMRARHRSILRAALAVVLLSAVAITGISGPAQATDISIPFDDLVFGTPGSTVTIATVAVDAAMVDRTCNLTVLAENQSSVHIGNDLIVSTGTSQAVIFGVEDTPNGGTSESYEIVVGPTILVQLRIGEDGMSSLGFDLSFDCVEPVVEQTTTAPTIDQQQLATTTTVDCAALAAGTDPNAATTATTAAQGAAGVSEACPPVCGDGTPGAGAIAGGTDTTSAGQATTETTVCATGQVVTTTTTTPTTVTPTVVGSSTNHLPETPAAAAVAGSPSYTG